MNLMLQKSKNWSENKANIVIMNRFHYKLFCRIGITMDQVKEEEITNDDIRGRFWDIKLLRDTWRKR